VSHPYEAVSFIKLGRKKGGGYWCVEPPAKYSKGWRYGEDRALELLQCVQNGAVDDLGFVLNQIADAQRAAGGDYRLKSLEGPTGAIYGFWRAIGWFASARALQGDFDAIAFRLRKQREDADARWAAQEREWKEEASERARHAARARWAKKAA
jgi:hypothetical protein